MFVTGWRDALRSEWPFINTGIIISNTVTTIGHREAPHDAHQQEPHNNLWVSVAESRISPFICYSFTVPYSPIVILQSSTGSLLHPHPAAFGENRRDE